MFKELMHPTFLVIGAVAMFGCSSDKATESPAGAVSGALDTHCGSKVLIVDRAACLVAPTGGADAGADASLATMALQPQDQTHTRDEPTTPHGDYGVTLFNSEGDDDDCKYHVKWTSTALAENTEVTFAVTATDKSDGKPMRTGTVRLEVFLNDTHPGPSTTQVTKEVSPGVYAAGPVKFDAPGRWTVRFHVNEQCTDSEPSPHGHAAFYVLVP